MSVTFITGIDTGIGKTYITGLLAKELYNKGYSVITVKPVQTGCDVLSEDILKHREIMGIPLTFDDIAGLTSPYVFKYPASPHLASKLEGVVIDINKVDKNIDLLSKKYEYVLIEGSGGLFTPITDNLNFADYIVERKYETILVTTDKLGSINHTIASIECMLNLGITIKEVIYNCFNSDNELIKKSTFDYLKNRYKNLDFKILG